MSDEKNLSRDEEKDSFWDLTNLVPKKRISSAESTRFSGTDMLADVVSTPSRSDPEGTVKESKFSEKSTVITHYVHPHNSDEEKSKPKPEAEYEPLNSLIHKVEIYPWRIQYNYFDQFDMLAHRYFNVKPQYVPENIPFFSYIPHYGHMDRAQLDWYLYWRSLTLEGKFVNTSYSYILLYAYELIALSDTVEPLRIRDLLCALWAAFRKEHPQLDRFMCDWICDLSIIHRIEPPSLERELFEAVMNNCTLKEYFIPCRGNDYRLYADVIAKYCSSYDYRKSKFYNAANAELYDKHIIAALEHVMSQYSDAGHIFSGIGLTDSHMVKDTFVGAICTHRVKKKIEVDYASFSRTNDLRYTVGSIIKHCENRIRAYLGIKSRFGAVMLHVGVRQCLDSYFDANLKGYHPSQLKKNNEPAEYEKMYDTPQVPFSREKALDIEKESWKTTRMLVDAFEDDKSSLPLGTDKAGDGDQSVSEGVSCMVETAKNAVEAKTVENIKMSEAVENAEPSEVDDTGLSSMSDELFEFLKLCFKNDTSGQRQCAKNAGKPVEAMADEINELAADTVGDIILTESDDGYGYCVIDFYADIVSEAIKGRG